MYPSPPSYTCLSVCDSIFVTKVDCNRVLVCVYRLGQSGDARPTNILLIVNMYCSHALSTACCESFSSSMCFTICLICSIFREEVETVGQAKSMRSCAGLWKGDVPWLVGSSSWTTLYEKRRRITSCTLPFGSDGHPVAGHEETKPLRREQKGTMLSSRTAPTATGRISMSSCSTAASAATYCEWIG